VAAVDASAEDEQGFNAGGGIGQLNLEIDNVDDVVTTVDVYDSDSDFTWSAGVGLNFFERFNVRLEYEQFDFNDVDNANALWLTGAFRF
jgi:opacity protein-like surface antigen